MENFPLEPSPERMREIGGRALDLLIEHIDSLPGQPSWNLEGAHAAAAALSAQPPAQGAPPERALQSIVDAAAHSLNTAHPGYLAFIPGGGLFTAAVAAMLADGLNRYAGMAFAAPALAQIETDVLRWMCEMYDLPSQARGILTSGGSLANLSAVVTARQARLGHDLTGGTIYVQEHTHHSVAKAALIAGIAPQGVRKVPCAPGLRMDPDALRRMIGEDRAAGLRPFAVVATLGTTNTGAIDPIGRIAQVARDEDLWLHADAAYGGFFQLTDRGRAAFAGVEHADSITLDPHKGMFLPYGTGALLVRDGERLRAAHTPEIASRAYLPDTSHDDEIWSFADYSPELSRGFRGAKVWLPLQIHGTDAFVTALNEKLDLARVVHEALSAEPGLDVPWEPELSTLAFRCAPGAGDADALNRTLLDEVNASKRIFISGTVIDGLFTPRVSILSHRTHREQIDEAIDIIVSAVRRLRAA